MRRLLFLSLLIIVLAAPTLLAQSREITFGARAGTYLDPTDAYAGLEVNVPITGAFSFNPSFEGIFADETLLALHADVNYMFDIGDDVSAFAGAGFSGILNDDDWESGVNVHGGAGIPLGTLWPYVHGRVLFNDGDTSPSLGVGLRF